MPVKYRRLSLEELQTLEQDFVLFLAGNQITAPEWEQIKTQSPERAEGLIEIFSDIVLEKVLGKIEYLQHRQGATLRLFHIQADKISMTALQVGSDDFDLNKAEDLQRLQANLGNLPIHLYHMEKPYQGERLREVFEMIQFQGCFQAEAAMYQQLSAMYEAQSPDSSNTVQ